ncbi:MAG: formylglycine-generating enzyme family protein, partial [Promethearchaeota archaeon]
MNVIKNSIGITFVKIPAGRFLMGQLDGWHDELPVHEVYITKPFYMSITPVTNVQWEMFRPDAKEDRGYWGVSEEDDSAVISVSWHDAVAFCDWLSK